MIIGITGGIACGKSTVSKMLEEFGATKIDVDAIGHQLLKKGEPEYDKIVELFGEGILDSSDEISRTKLGKIVFSCPKKRSQLNAIMHPPMIEQALKKAMNFHRNTASVSNLLVVLLDSPLLIEAGLHRSVDLVVVVICAEATQIDRIIARSIKSEHPLNVADAKARIRSQMPIEEKVKYADFVIENNGGFDELREKVGGLWRFIKRQKATGFARF